MRVFCSECKYNYGTRNKFACYHLDLAEVAYDWYGEEIIAGNPAEINENNDCGHYDPYKSPEDKIEAREEWLRRCRHATKRVHLRKNT